MKKLKKMLSGILATVMSVSMLGAVPVSALVEIPLEKTDVDGYDFYSCEVSYYLDENGEKVPVYHDIYYDFTSDFWGTYYEFGRDYQCVFVTISDNAVAEELDNVLGEHLDTVLYYEVADNQIVYEYSSEFDYKTLYDIAGVEKVELAKNYYFNHFTKHLVEVDWFKENGIDPYNSNLLMSDITTDDETELTVEMFDVTGYDVKYVYEVSDNNWRVYFEYDGIDSYIDFDNKARKIDGILNSNVSFLRQVSGSITPKFAFDTVLKELLGDINFDDTVDIYDAVEIAKSVMGMREFSESELILADFNNDSEVNIYDAIEISKTLMS